MNKIGTKEIAAYVAANNGISKAAAEAIVKDAFGFVRDAVTNGDEVTLHNFGKFTTTARAARTGRNPKTGAPLEIPASKIVKFKPTSSFKEEVK